MTSSFPMDPGQNVQRALILVGQRRYCDAMPLLERAVAALRRDGGDDQLFRAVANLGICCYELSRYADARRHFEESLAMARRLQNDKAVASTLYELAMSLWRVGELEKAIAACRESVDIELRYGSEATLALHGLAILYQEAGEYTKAREALQIVRESCEARKDLAGLGRALNELGCVEVHLGNIGQAATHLYESMKVKRQIGDDQGLKASMENLRSLLRSSAKAILDPTVREIVRAIARDSGRPFAW